MSPDRTERRVEEVVDSFDQLVALLERFEPVETVLTQLVAFATTTIPGTASATVTVVRHDDARTLAASHGWATALDEQQYAAQDGPCLHAIRTGRVVRMDIAKSDRWPAYCAAARSEKVAAVLSVPLLVDEDIVDTAAALNLTTAQPEAFDPLDEALLELFTHALSVVINHAYRHRRAAELVDQLGAALETRDVIGTAKGLLMAQHSCGPERAFELLRAASQRSNTKLRDVAAHLVRNETR